MKMLFGFVFFLVDVGALVFGASLTLIGVGFWGDSSGQGNIKVIVEKVGEITGANGQLVLALAGVIVVLAALGYASKAVVEAIKYEGGTRDIIQHFNPSL
jgi:hypothetical protein